MRENGEFRRIVLHVGSFPPIGTKKPRHRWVKRYGAEPGLSSRIWPRNPQLARQFFGRETRRISAREGFAGRALGGSAQAIRIRITPAIICANTTIARCSPPTETFVARRCPAWVEHVSRTHYTPRTTLCSSRCAWPLPAHRPRPKRTGSGVKAP